MARMLIATLAVVALIVLSRRANRKFVHERRLPMQWSLSGSVHWTAPRPLALALTPVLATVTLAAAPVATFALTPRSGQAGQEVTVIALQSAGFVAVHGLHLWLIDRQLTANGG